MATIINFLWVLQAIHLSMGYPSGSPVSQCGDMIPSHGVKDQTSQPPYQVILSKLAVQGGESVRVRLAGPTVPFKGFLAMGYKVPTRGASSDSAHPGKILPLTNSVNVKTLDCFEVKHSALTHTDASLKKDVEFDWIPPNEDGVYVILVTFVKDFKTFWLRVPSAEIKVTRNPNFFPEEDDTIGDQNPNAFEAVLNEIREKHFAGCGVTKGCFGYPPNCFTESDPNRVCEMFTSWKKTSKNGFKFQISGRLPGWNTYEDTKTLTEGHISSGLSHDNIMGADTVIGCVLKDGKVQPKSYFNLPGDKQNSIFKNETTGLLYGSTGNYTNGFLLCEFTRTAILEDTTKEIGANFDLLKNPLHIILARASSMSINRGNKREKLGYHSGPEDKAVSERAILLSDAYTYKEPENDNQDSQHGGNGIPSATTKPDATSTKKPSVDSDKKSSADSTIFSLKALVLFIGVANLLG